MLASDLPGYEKALAKRSELAALIKRLRDTHDHASMSAIDDELCAHVEPGIYEHFKSSPDSQKFYAVRGLLPDVNHVLMPMVKYASLYAPYSGKEAGRALYDQSEGFFDPVDKAEYKGPRFKLIMPLSEEEATTLMFSVRRNPVPQSRAEALEELEARMSNLGK